LSQDHSASAVATVRPNRDWQILTGSWLASFGLAALVFAWWRTPADLSSIRSAHVAALGGSMAIAAGGLAVLALRWRATVQSRRIGFWRPLGTSLALLAVAFAFVELGLRLLAQPDPMGIRIGALPLAPYDWGHVAARNRDILARIDREPTVYVGDTELGWSLGPSRRSSNGLYATSIEGFRSATPGEKLIDDSGTHDRIVITGDSFAFSDEVPFAQSLQAHLQRKVGDQLQVVSVGVSGYGIDQAVLRYEAEAPRISSRVSILQFIQDDVHRVGGIYLFNRPTWGDYPFVKPRFVQGDRGLERVESPTAEATYGFASVFDLPNLALDESFDSKHWVPSLFGASYAWRLLATRYPRWGRRTEPSTRTGSEFIAEHLIRRFIEDARREGSRPVVVYFPSSGDFNGVDRTMKDRIIGRLASSGFQVHDLSGCMREGDTSELIVRGGSHYSNLGNERMAGCLLPLVTSALDGGAS
jgi:hypothetical protein